MSHKKKGISRRTFLKGAGAAAAGTVLGGKLSTQGIFAPNVVHARDEVVLAVQEFTHDILNGVLPDFEEATGLTVKLEGGPASGTDMLTKYSTAFAAGNSPVDVFSDSDESSPAFMRAGWLVPLDDVIPQEVWEDFPASMQGQIENFHSFDGVRYRIPHGFEMGYFFTRKDWLDAEGIAAPTTWDEIIEIGQQFADKDEGIWGTTDGLTKPALLYVFMAYLTAQAGGDIFAFDEQTADAFEFLYDMIHTHQIFPEDALNQDYTAQNELYMANKVAFMRQWPFFQAVAEGNEDWFAPEKVKIELPPAGPGGSKSWAGGWGWSLPTSAPNSDGAEALIQFLNSKDVAWKLAEQQGFFLTARDSVLEQVDPEKQPILPALSMYSENDVPAARPFHPRIAEAQNIVDDMASLYLTKQASLGDVMQQGQELIAELEED
jgi:multiple sugar transport system substrate-binding protein